jgi:hypothetical protein
MKKLGITKIDKDFGVDGVMWSINATQEKIDLFCDNISL